MFYPLKTCQKAFGFLMHVMHLASFSFIRKKRKEKHLTTFMGLPYVYILFLPVLEMKIQTLIIVEEIVLAFATMFPAGHVSILRKCVTSSCKLIGPILLKNVTS